MIMIIVSIHYIIINVRCDMMMMMMMMIIIIIIIIIIITKIIFNYQKQCDENILLLSDVI